MVFAHLFLGQFIPDFDKIFEGKGLPLQLKLSIGQTLVSTESFLIASSDCT